MFTPSEPMNVNILLFATLKDQIGTNRLSLELPAGTTVGELKGYLAGQYPQLKPYLSRAVVSINREFAFDPDLVPDNAEVGMFPPVSGGAGYPTICKVVTEVIDINSYVDEITFNTTGAICMFTGIVRGITKQEKAYETISLVYEAYVPMAEEKMYQVAEEIRNRWPCVEGIVIIQRIGRLDAGVPTVLIACSAAHRDTGVFEAARYGIDRLKEVVPIWKKEVGSLGELWLEGDYTPKKGD